MSLESAYKQALLFTKSHYENFPVISYFLPKHLKEHVAVVYQFARQADDIADEGEFNSELRIENLELYEESLKKCITGKFENDFWFALNNTISVFKLTPKYFFDLLSAFRQDVVKTRYKTFEEILNYCERSANPVGRIILEFFNIYDEESCRYSDSVCTALQLTNFYQDVSVDIQKGRIYVPIDEMQKFGVTEDKFELRKNNTNFEQLLKYEVDRTKKLFREGRKLLPRLPKELKRQIQMTINGGEKILEIIEEYNYDVLHSRPSLTKLDYIKLFFRTFLND
ncbi:MAG: squalene synthase HpnC [Ignavibacteriales bacterium]|nr:squalene synthase HpnC [Ignavibacteriales bacterium]